MFLVAALGFYIFRHSICGAGRMFFDISPRYYCSSKEAQDKAPYRDILPWISQVTMTIILGNSQIHW